MTTPFITDKPKHATAESRALLAQHLDKLQVLGDTLFNKIFNALDQPYTIEDAIDDRDGLSEQIRITEEGFKHALLNIHVPNSTEKGETLEDLIKKCNEGITTSHMETERIKKSTHSALARISDPFKET